MFVRSKIIPMRLAGGEIARYKYYYEVESERVNGKVVQRNLVYLGKDIPGFPSGGRIS